MKNWTNSIALALMAATFTLAGCTEDGPGSVAAVPEPEPGDPGVYAPDGWPLQIGDKVSWMTMGQLHNQFRLPLSGKRSPWTLIVGGLHLVEDRVYAPRFEALSDPKKRSESEWPDRWVYRGHFRTTFEAFLRNTESHLPPEFHGKVEYQTQQDRRRWPDYLELRK